MKTPKVIVTRKWPEEVEQQLTADFDTELNASDEPMTTVQLQDALRTADALLPTVSDAIDAEVLSAEPLRTRIIGSYGVGFNHIDLDAAKARGLMVTNTPEVLTDCTADLALTLLLMVARRAGEGERHLRGKDWTGWRPTHMVATRISGKTLGLVGMGRIARAVAKRAHHGFGMRILFHDPFPPSPEEAEALGAQACATIEEVLENSDFVSLHCPGGDETHHLMNTERLAAMRPGAFLINTARGNVVDEQALVQALQSRAIAGAGLDVYEREPKVAEDLLSMENVVLLPHLGSATIETRIAMGMRVIENVKASFADETPRDKLV